MAQPPVIDDVLAFMSEYGRSYLSSGGPTSRLEDSLHVLGRKLGFPTEVFATPTGIFVNCLDQNRQNHTTLCRIKDSGTNLGRLCWLEGIFEDVSNGKISLSQANKILNGKYIKTSPYTLLQTILAAFLSGFALSYPAFRMLGPALASGLIATLTWWLTGPALKPKIPSSTFRDFIGCAFTLACAGFCQIYNPAPFEAYSIGGIIVLVPGLSLTTAISELADQNLVSGSAKLMQSMLTLLALGLAYFLFQDLSDALGIMPAPGASAQTLSLGISVFGIIVSVFCFGILFRVPKKSLLWSTLTGVLGWAVFRAFGTGKYIAASAYLASLSVGVVALCLGSRFKVPSQVYSVPGILAMLPGLLALTSLRSMVMGEQANGMELGFRVALTAGAIVFGLFTARIPFAFKKNQGTSAKT